jgi:nucleotide-binding universal stress UspA family protein
MKILFAADGSEHTKLAARYLVSLARALAQPPVIHVLHVHPPLPYAGAVSADAVTRYHKEESEAALAVAEAVLRAADLKYTSTWIAGEIPAEIAGHAQREAIDLIVMGSHGRGLLRTLALGSVADGVLRAARVPVTIVR